MSIDTLPTPVSTNSETSASSEVNTYTGEAESIPDEAILGSVVWYTISETDVPLEQARQSAQDLGLPARHLRKNLRPVDAFAKAANEFGHKFPEDEQGVVTTFLVRSVGQTKDLAFRYIVRERAVTGKGKKRRRLSYDTVAELVLHKGHKNKEGEYEGHFVEVNRVDSGLDMADSEREWLDARLSEFPVRYKHWCTHIDDHAVRTFVRNSLSDLAATCIKPSGGVYFVRQAYKGQLGALATWTKRLGSSFHTLPLVDLLEQRKMVADSFESEAVGQLDQHAKAIAKILKDPDRTIRKDTFDKFMRVRSDLRSKASEYAGTLDRKLSLVEERLSLYNSQALQLLDRVSDDE